MASHALVCVGVLALVLTFLQVLAVATANWLVIEMESEPVGIGLFQVCWGSKCVSYIDVMTKDKTVPFSYIAFVGLHIAGVIPLLASGVYSLRYCTSARDGQARGIVNKSAIMLCVAGGCILGGVLWFYLDMQDALHLLGMADALKFGYSFYLAAVTAAFSIVLSISMCVVASRMDIPPVITTFVAPQCQPTVVIQQSTTTHSDYGQTQPNAYPLTSPVALTQNGTTGIPQSNPIYGYDQQ